MKVEMLNPQLLEPSAYNPRKFSAEEMASLRKSIREFGLVQPILVQMPGNRIIAGHQRRDAAIAEGIKRVPVVRLKIFDNLSRAKVGRQCYPCRLLEGCFNIPHDGPPDWLFMLVAYLDESGHEGNELVIVAGYLGKESQWRRFADDWKVGLGRRKSLHMSSLRWSSPRTKKLLEVLAPIPNRCGLQRMIGAVRVKDYEDLISGSRLEKTMKGYLVALQAAVLPALIKIPAHERLELVLESQFEYEFQAGQYLGQISKLSPLLSPEVRKYLRTTTGKSKLANWRYAPKTSTALFEPADYLAYALLQKWRNPEAKKAEWCNPILGNGEYLGWFMKREQVRDVILRIPQMLAESRRSF